MAVKKSEIYGSLWASCDALRGGMDASLYKDYVLVLLFMKYVSDRYAGDPDAAIVVPPGGSFADMLALKADAEIGDNVNVIIRTFADANGLGGVIDTADFGDHDKLGAGKELVDRVSALIRIFARPELDFRRNRADGDDILGDAYEYLMRHFATESGKSKGQFYTPAEVSRVMAKVIGVRGAKRPDQTIYDPTCGSGSLLLKAQDEAPFALSLYGQEKDVATHALARMNMVLHDCPTAEIWRGNTLSDPHFKFGDGSLKTFDFVVANPPFSDKAWTTGVKADDKRFEPKRPPAKNGDFAYLLHVVASLRSTGKGAVILPHGVLFRGHAEAEIRERLVRRGVIAGLIGLPPNLFFGTGIPACLVVLDSENAAARTGIFMIDASRGFAKDGPKNRLRARDVHRIVDAWERRADVPRFARVVPRAEIERHGWNLNIPRYIDASDPEDLHDIEAHLKGGLPGRDVDALGEVWAAMPGLRPALFEPGERPGTLQARAEGAEARAAVLEHPDFAAWAGRVRAAFAEWREVQEGRLRGIRGGDSPKALAHALGEDLLARFGGVPLVDPYAMYQHLMAWWGEAMGDDVHLVAQGGWAEARSLREILKNKDGKYTEAADVVLGRRRFKAEVIPPALVVARFFAAERVALDALEERAEAAGEAVREVDEEDGEDGPLARARTEKDKLTIASVKARRKEARREAGSEEEVAALDACLKLLEAERTARDAAKAAQTALDAKVVARYPALTEDETRDLVVDDKWLARLQADVEGEVEAVARGLGARVATLAARYAVPLGRLEDDAAAAAARVTDHLARMGFAA